MVGFRRQMKTIFLIPAVICISIQSVYPWQDVLEMKSQQQLYLMSPYTYASYCLNFLTSLSWLIHNLLTEDYVFVGAFGIQSICSAYFMYIVVNTQPRQRRISRLLFMSSALIMSLMGLLLDPELTVQLTATLLTIISSLIPLGNLRLLLQDYNQVSPSESSLFSTIVSLLSNLMWGSYGATVGDQFIFLPNILAAAIDFNVMIATQLLKKRFSLFLIIPLVTDDREAQHMITVVSSDSILRSQPWDSRVHLQ
ncbi:hypothetical protein PROFUN_13163 [Planoprotostelium fungivorum]|uniref:Bidirectional sugar transporter SWEET n=1 Tax=Planoprotostelium fungivorum TaxID=1890364 RepID=A0A2P6N574_9EUKA|nr:hypothetical protein PROFUN_13163 [Planoprotostelium fungivorum]